MLPNGQTPSTRFASSLSTEQDLDTALHEVADQALAELETTPDLAFVFVSADRVQRAAYIAKTLTGLLDTECLVGCAATSVIGRGTEIEASPAVSVWLAKLPATQVLTMHLAFEATAEGNEILGWPDELLESCPDAAALIVLGEPFSFPAELLLQQIDARFPGCRVVGGMTSAAHQPGGNALLLGTKAFSYGAVCVLLSGSPQVCPVVSQGCRPIGEPFVVTQSEGNVIQELGGQTAMTKLQQLFETLPNSEKELLHRGLHLGRVVSEYQDHRGQGDFLVRNVTGIDSETGAMTVGDYFRCGQTVQFHVRDQATADGEMRQLFSEAVHLKQEPLAGLLFSCNGRGTRLFDVTDHDVGLVAEYFGEIPLAGFFAAGELGPVGSQNFVHGLTASLAVFMQEVAVDRS
ncbi:MAG: FIST N-terminal domain-containing protein [Planctomycetota bacterium]|nr:FIST N-terminal domain-containing protein [Planctomycetota bacterium]